MPIVRDGTGPRALAKEVVQLTASATINESHNGRVLQCNSGSTVTLTLPATLPPGFAFEVEQVGAGVVVFSADTNATLRQRASGDRTAGQYARVRCEVATNAARNNAAWTLSGDVVSATPGIASVSWSVAAGAANICIMTGTIKDGAGNTIAASRPLDIYISAAATGIGISGTSYSTGASITTGTSVIAFTANKAWRINTHTDGTFAISITATGKPATEYGVAILSATGQLSVSAASAALWG